mgnify:FL=1
MWETEPKEVPDLDIYYQASNLNPIYITDKTKENVIPIGSTFTTKSYQLFQDATLDPELQVITHTVTSWSGTNEITFTPATSGVNAYFPSSGGFW